MTALLAAELLSALALAGLAGLGWWREPVGHTSSFHRIL